MLQIPNCVNFKVVVSCVAPCSELLLDEVVDKTRTRAGEPGDEGCLQIFVLPSAFGSHHSWLDYCFLKLRGNVLILVCP